LNVIIEGVDGAGKTTLIRQIADELDCDILSMTRCGSKEYSDYVAKAQLRRMVSDRSFLSEIVYCTVFGRKCSITPLQMDSLIKYYRSHGWKFYLLDADVETIHKRLAIRGDDNPYNVIEKIDSLRAAYLAFAYFYDIPIIKSEELDVEKFIAELKG
jgi:thymidylate kinase